MEVTIVPTDGTLEKGTQAAGSETRWVLTMALYFDEARSALWAQQALRLAKEVACRIGVSFSHFSVRPLESRSSDLRAEYTYRWIPRNVGRFEALISSRNVKAFDVCFVENPKTDYVTHGPFGFLARLDPGDVPGGSVYLQLGPELLTRWQGNLKEGLYSVVRGFDEIADIRYGYVQPMSLAKAPYVFPIGGAGERTTRLEKRDNALWRRFASDYRRQMRNLYWGNVLTHEHCLLSFDEALERIRDVVSGENVCVLRGEKAFFILPVELEDIEDRDHCERYHEIRETLEPYLRFMVPDEWVSKVASVPPLGEIIGTAQIQHHNPETEEEPKA